ncbi:MAG TPA: hypothetical protein VG963_30220, partial [Polyangiaceae bacterium]|nr:hypothetical protein [Polyangiaceae bacterium]
MTTTEPDLLLAQVEHRETSAERTPTWLGLAGGALLGSFLAVLLSVGLSLIAFEGSYAGAHDDTVAARAVSTYQPFLEMVARELGWIGLAE